MHVRMLYKDREFDTRSGYFNKEDIIKDLNLNLIFQTMSRYNDFDHKAVRNQSKEDSFIYETAKRVMMCPLVKEEDVLYRQGFLKEGMGNPSVFEEMYRVAAEAKKSLDQYAKSAKEKRNKHNAAGGQIISNVEMLQCLVFYLDQLKKYLEQVKQDFISEEMKEFYNRFQNGYSDEFSSGLRETIKDMNFLTEGGKVSFSATVGQGMKEENIIIHHVEKTGYQGKEKPTSVQNVKHLYLKLFKPNVFLLKEEEMIHDARVWEESIVRYILAYFDEFIEECHIFFRQLHFQTAFYLGCVNLYLRLSGWTLPLAMPKAARESEQLSFRGLYDLSMGILTRKRPVSNELDGNGKRLIVITGANQGGKSTYLRSIGIAQILLQSGMFVPAEGYVSNLHSNIYTHFTRREDSAMNSGRLDEELKRMDRILRTVTSDSLLLLNESFASTTEKEGSVIAADLTRALYEAGIKVFMVTHLFAFARERYREKPEHAVFLTAERRDDGMRTYRILEDEPSMTSYGLDLYQELIEKVK